MKNVILIDGQPSGTERPLDADIVETEPGVYSVIIAGASWEVRVSGSEIAIGEHRFTFEIEDPRQWKRSAHADDSGGRASLTAAMPGKVVRILVAVGDRVKKGQGLIAIEAMKMQNELKAPRDGEVTAILVQENDSVVAGTVLVSID